MWDHCVIEHTKISAVFLLHRERKKAEYNELQSAVDQLTAQLAAIRALEARNEDLVMQNTSLVDTQNMHTGIISSLQEEVGFCAGIRCISALKDNL